MKRTQPSLLLENLESRINLSSLPALTPDVPALFAAGNQKPAIVSAVKNAATSKSSTSTKTTTTTIPTAGATSISGSTSVPIPSDSAIANCQVVWDSAGAVVGYISSNNAYVEYTVTAPSAGTYNLALGVASPSASSIRVDVNGATTGAISAPSTGSWSKYATASTQVQLAAGTNVIRLTSLNYSIYNLNALTISAGTSMSTASSTVTSVGDNTNVGIPSYSSISNEKLEYQNGPDIGYVAGAGSYVEYTVNVATAGTYALSVGAGGYGTATFDVSANGAKLTTFSTPSTNSWVNYGTYTQNVYLNAGQQTLRFTSANGVPYNLFAINLARQASTTATPVTGGVTVNQRWMTSFTELDITGTANNDTIYISQSGATLTITANGQTQQVTGNFGDMVIQGLGGNDTITVDGSVWVNSRLYGGAGNDSLTDLTHGKATIVSFGGGSDLDAGNGVNTSYWVDNSDTVNASGAEWNAGRVHIISGFYQPYTTNPGGYGYVTNDLDGENIVDPASNGAGWTRLTNSSMWGTGPVMEDITQGAVGDCYYLTALQSLAKFQPDRLRELAVDLGDGTYAVQFKRNGVTQYVRVDGDLPTGQYGGLQYAHIPGSGDEWAAIMEKAYAYFRTGANSYSSIDTGWMGNVYSDFGIASTNYSLPSDQNSFYSTVSNALANNRPVDLCTNSYISNGAPLVSAHTYSVLAVSKDSSGTVWVTLRNPWGYDGFSYDSNPWDGLLTISYASLYPNISLGAIVS